MIVSTKINRNKPSTRENVRQRKNSLIKRKFSILLVDDEERILYFLKTKLKLLGYDVLTATNGIEALEMIIAQQPNMVVMDVVMPGKDGFLTLKELRAFSTIPVIMLSALSDDTNRIKGLGLGADDYLSKPFNPDELIARIEAVKRRLNQTELNNNPKIMNFSSISLNFDDHRLLVRGTEVKLTKVEWLLLYQLASNSGHLMAYYDLLTKVWGPEYRNDVQILRTWISRLRLKIEAEPSNPKYIRTVPKTGYIFDGN